jgi:hypothetical protein
LTNLRRKTSFRLARYSKARPADAGSSEDRAWKTDMVATPARESRLAVARLVLQARWLVPVGVAWAINHAARIALHETDGGRLGYLLGAFNPWDARSSLGLELAIVAAIAYTSHRFCRPGIAPMAALSLLFAFVYAVSYTHYHLLGSAVTFDRIADIPQLIGFAPLYASVLLGGGFVSAVVWLLRSIRRPNDRATLVLPIALASVVVVGAHVPARAVAGIDAVTRYDSRRFVGNFFRRGTFVFSIRDYLQQKQLRERLFQLGASRPSFPFDDFQQGLAGLTNKRNVYIVLLESHVDPRDFHGLGTLPVESVDPRYRHWRETAAGTAISPVVGGRTANAELEVLCGVPAYESLGAIPFNNFGGASIPCLPHLLGAIGYQASASAPTPTSYFNILTAYRSLGFTETHFLKDFDQSDLDGWLISTSSVLQQSLAWTRKRLTSGRPSLTYTVTIAGHFPFDMNHKRRPPVIASDIGVFSKVLNHSYYVSRAIADYAEELHRIDPGALLVMFSDHVPPIPADEYKRADYLGTRDGGNDLQLHLVPLFVFDRGQPVPVPPLPHYLIPEMIIDRLTGGSYCAGHPCLSQKPYLLRPPYVADRSKPEHPVCTTDGRQQNDLCSQAASLDRKLTNSFYSLVKASRFQN